MMRGLALLDVLVAVGMLFLLVYLLRFDWRSEAPTVDAPGASTAAGR
jgi:hypothetical protein